MKTNKDYYDLRFSSEELMMIDSALSNAGVDKDQQDAYNRLRHLLSKHVEINDVLDGTIPEPSPEINLQSNPRPLPCLITSKRFVCSRLFTCTKIREAKVS